MSRKSARNRKPQPEPPEQVKKMVDAVFVPVRRVVPKIGHALWIWWVVLALGLFACGAGVNAMYGNDYLIAAVLYFIGVSYLTIKAAIAIKDEAKRGGVVFVIILGAAVFLGSMLWVRNRRWKHQQQQLTMVPAPTPELHGVLIPANDQRPITDCRIPPDAVALFLGDSVGFTTDKLIAIHAGDDELVSIKRETAGIYVSARVYSEANKVSASISDNELFVNPGNFFERPDRSDWHTLIVKDNSGKQVLYVSFINKSTIKLLGTFSTLS